jgi:hypothetical protein
MFLFLGMRFIFIYIVVSLVLSRSFTSDFSGAMKLLLRLVDDPLHRSIYNSFDCYDWYGVILEMIVLIFMMLATIIIVKTAEGPIDVLFDFAGLMVVQKLDNTLVATDYVRFRAFHFPRHLRATARQSNIVKGTICQFILFCIIFFSLCLL